MTTAEPLPSSSSLTAPGSSTLQSAQDYYGKVLQSSNDLRTSACCSAPSGDRRVREALKRVHPDVSNRYYGCGSPIPPLLQGTTSLDLGCGTGRDCFVLSQLAGPNSRVMGLDATESQLQVGRSALPWHQKENTGSAPIDFVQGDMSHMAGLVDDASIDVVVSNCVLNLTSEKEAVFREIARVLRPGGELLFADIFASEILDPSLLSDPVLHGECLAGAHFLPQLQEQLSTFGMSRLYIMASTPVEVHDEELRRKLGENVSFTSLTVRAFKDIGTQQGRQGNQWEAQFKGDEHNKSFTFDRETVFSCPSDCKQITGDVADIFAQSRYAPLFDVRELDGLASGARKTTTCCGGSK